MFPVTIAVVHVYHEGQGPRQLFRSRGTPFSGCSRNCWTFCLLPHRLFQTNSSRQGITMTDSADPNRTYVQFLSAFSTIGLVVAAIFFGLSVTPSMVPRAPELQGVLGGVVASIGYLVWWLAFKFLVWLGVPVARALSRKIRLGFGSLGMAVVAASLWKAADWQNSILAAWGLAPIDATAPLRIAVIGGAVFLGLLVAGRTFAILARTWQRRSQNVLPPRLAQAAGLVASVAIFAALVEGFAFRAALRTIDASARIADAIVLPDLEPPVSPFDSGGPNSLLAWEDLGRWGRVFVASGPSAEDIAAFWDEPAHDPIRVYIGLNAAITPEARAQLALDELRRVDGFDRAILVIAMPTGSGWLDPGSMDTLDYMARGDVATVAVQYSYLPSPVSVVVDPTAGMEEAQRLFDLVYRRWTNLPRDRRPKLYLHGLSLGAYLSQETVPLLDVFSDPFDGALWAGSPFLSEFWRMVVNRRQTGSPAWRPRFGNGSLVRTMNQYGGLAAHDSEWGPIRLVLLQYGSDPIVFFDWSLAWRKPDWLAEDRAPDLSPMMRWVPLVTMLQVGVDMTVALGALGYGHDYTVRHYIPAWAEALGPAYWDADTEARLIEHLRDLVPR